MTPEQREKLLEQVRERAKQQSKDEPDYVMMKKGGMVVLVRMDHVELRLKNGWKFFNF